MTRLTPKRLLWLSGLSTTAVIGFFFKSRIFSRLVEQTTSNEVLFHGHTKKRLIALTIDDGPYPPITPEILDILAEYNVPATFFVIGERIHGNEALIERMVAEGHELGNHLMRDERSVLLDPDELNRQLAETHALITRFAPVRWFRPGSGIYNERMLAAIKPYNYHCVIGSIYPYDAHIHSADFASRYIIGNTQPGSIIIIHDGKPERQPTTAVLRRIIPTLQKRGYQFVTLSTLASPPN